MAKAQTFTFQRSIYQYQTGITVASGAYQSYVNSFIHLKRQAAIPIFNPKEELTIYSWLLWKLLNPKYLVFQASGYPMAALSSELETFHPTYFKSFEFKELNMLRTISSGPEEPYALSMLFGNIAFLGYKEKIDATKTKLKQSGSALAGILVTTGNFHIQDNIRINDRWWQTELILTGLLSETLVRKLNWNFRLGIKIHKNRMVPDVAIISLFRNHTDWQKKRLWSIERNSILRYEAHFPIGQEWSHCPGTIRQLLSYGKKFPVKIRGRSVAIQLAGGVLWEWIRLYNHELRFFEPKETTQLTWLIQPNVEF